MSAMGNYVLGVEEFIYELMAGGLSQSEIREAVRKEYGSLGLGVLENIEVE